MALPKPPGARAGVIERSKQRYGKAPSRANVDATMKRTAKRARERARAMPKPPSRGGEVPLPPQPVVLREGGGLPLPKPLPPAQAILRQGGGLPLPKGIVPPPAPVGFRKMPGVVKKKKG